MRLVVISIGRLKQGPERELAERYRERFDDIGRKLGFRGLEIHEIPESRARDAATRIARRPRRFRPQFRKNPCWWRWTSAARIIDSAAFARPSWPLAGCSGRQHYFRDRRRGRTFARIAAQGKTEHRVRRRDLAASDGSRHASGTDLPGRDHSGRPPLSPRLSRVSASAKQRAPNECDAADAEHPCFTLTAGRRGRASAVRIPLSLALLAAGLAGMRFRRPRFAQLATDAAPTAASATPSSSASRNSRPRARSKRARRKLQEKLKADIAAIGQDRSKLNQQLIDIAAQVRGVETKIGDAEARLRPLDAREQQIRGSLDSRRSEIVEVLAALQRAGRRTPPALAGAARGRAAIAAHRDAARLRGAGIARRARKAGGRSRRTRQRCARPSPPSATSLAADRDKLQDDQTRLAALVDERQRQQSSIEKDMEAEGARAIALSQQVDSLQGLIAKMEQDLKSAAKAAASRQPAGRARQPLNGKPNLAALKDPARLSPAIAFASAKGLLAMPVNGTKIRDFGGSDGAGGVEKGISLATRPGAQVTTPCDGWVVYAGPFRSYGQLLILNAGGGYHVLIAGMERISVNIGQFVLTGEPVATMGIDIPGRINSRGEREPARALYRVP